MGLPIPIGSFVPFLSFCDNRRPVFPHPRQLLPAEEEMVGSAAHGFDQRLIVKIGQLLEASNQLLATLRTLGDGAELILGI